MTPEEFYLETVGKSYDYDGMYGCQCWDGWMALVDKLGLSGKFNANTYTGYVNGIWNNRKISGVLNYFDEVSTSDLQKGDVVIWDYGSRSHPKSHIGLFWGFSLCYGTNQGGTNGAFNVKATDFSDAMGALRYKGWAKKMDMHFGQSFHKFNDIDVNVIFADKSQGYDLHMITANGATELKDIMEFDSDYLRILGMVNWSYFEMNNPKTYGTHYGIEYDALLDQYTQTISNPDVVAYTVNHDDSISITRTDAYEINANARVTLSPYAVRMSTANGDNVTKEIIHWSRAYGDKDDLLNTQTALFRINGNWGIATFSKCYPRDVVAFFKQFEGIEEVLLGDSGGSTQMVSMVSGTRQKVVYTGRKIADVVCLAKRIEKEAKEDGTSDNNNAVPNDGNSSDPDFDDETGQGVTGTDLRIKELEAKVDELYSILDKLKGVFGNG